MKINSKKDQKIKRLLLWYNSIPTVLWSILNLFPISVYCYDRVELPVLFIFIAISMVPAFLPGSLLDRIRVSNNPFVYKRLGVNLANKLTQNGGIVNKLVKRRFPEYRAVGKSRASINGLVQQTYMFEKFHLLMFVLFSLVGLYAVLNNHYVWAAVILATNVVYNGYPILLQQYIRLKLGSGSSGTKPGDRSFFACMPGTVKHLGNPLARPHMYPTKLE